MSEITPMISHKTRPGFDFLDKLVELCFNSCCQHLKDFDFYTGLFDEVYNDLADKKLEKNYVVLLTTDYINNDQQSFTAEPRPACKAFINLISKHSSTTFIVCSTLVNFLEQFEHIPDNLIFLHIGLEMDFNCVDGYKIIDPILQKNFDSTKHWISLSANCHDWRLHRPLAGTMLLGLNLEDTGNLRFSGKEFVIHDSWLTYKSYHKYNNRDQIDQFGPYDQIMLHGMNKAKIWKNHSNTDDVFHQVGYNQTHKNLQKFLTPMYKNSFVEIVNETIFFQKSGIITEKTLQSMFGCNFPIILSFPGTVGHLRSQGYDMFDDIIDHSYDTIHDPFVRLSKAILDNYRILRDGDFAKQNWKKNTDRFVNNVNHWKQKSNTRIDEVFKNFETLVKKL